MAARRGRRSTDQLGNSIDRLTAVNETLVESLDRSLSNLGQSLQPTFSKVTDLQQQLLQFGFNKPMETARKLQIAEVPGLTNLAVTTALVRTGLDRNSQSIGKYLARSELLGENINIVADSILGLSDSLALSKESQSNLVQSLYDSAKTYNVSTEYLIEAVRKFSDQLPAQAVLGNKNLIEALGEFAAMLGPGGKEIVDKAIMPFLKSGFDADLTRSIQLGIYETVERLNDSSRSVDQMLVDLQELVTTSSRTGSEFLGSIGSARVVSANFKELAEATRTASAAVERLSQRDIPLTGKEKEEATLKDLSTAFSTIGARMAEPLVNLSKNIVGVMEAIGDLGTTIVTSIVFIGMARNVFKVYAALQGVSQRLGLILTELTRLNAKPAALPGSSGPPKFGPMSNYAGLTGNAPIFSPLPAGSATAPTPMSPFPIGPTPPTPPGFFRRLTTSITRPFSRLGGVISSSINRVMATTLVTTLGTALKGVLGFIIGPIGQLILVITSMLPIMDWIGGSSEETQENTNDTVDEIKRLSSEIKPEDTASKAKSLLSSEAALIGAMMQVRARDDLFRQLKSTEAQEQLLKDQNEQISNLIDIMNKIESKRAPNPSLGARGIGGF